MGVVKRIVPHLLLRRHQEPDHEAAPLEETLRIHVRHVVELFRRLAHLEPRAFRDRQPGVRAVEHLRHRAGAQPHVAGQLPDRAVFRFSFHRPYLLINALT